MYICTYGSYVTLSHQLTLGIISFEIVIFQNETSFDYFSQRKPSENIHVHPLFHWATLKKSLFPVQRVAEIMRPQILFPPPFFLLLGWKNTGIFVKRKKKKKKKLKLKKKSPHPPQLLPPGRSTGNNLFLKGGLGG